ANQVLHVRKDLGLRQEIESLCCPDDLCKLPDIAALLWSDQIRPQDLADDNGDPGGGEFPVEPLSEEGFPLGLLEAAEVADSARVEDQGVDRHFTAFANDRDNGWTRAFRPT